MSDAGTLSAGQEMEYLGTPPSERRRVPRAVTAGLVLAAVVAAGAVVGSEATRQAANNRLLDTFLVADARASSGERQVLGTLAYASPMIWSTSVSAEVRAGLRAVVEESAAEVAADFAALRETATGTLVLPWHTAQADARTELVALLDDQQARFDGIARDASDIDLVLAGGPLPNGAALAALRASGASPGAAR